MSTIIASVACLGLSATENSFSYYDLKEVYFIVVNKDTECAQCA